MPPALSTSTATKRPPGFRSTSTGVRRQISWKSSMASGTPASRAMASRCSTALVDPPVAATPAIALAKAARVAIWRGRRVRRTASMTIWPQRKITSALPGSARGARARDSVGKSRARGDLARQAVAAHGVHDDLAATETHIGFARVDLGDRGRAHGREADQFQHGGHGIGGELPAARARAGAGVVLDFQQFLIGHPAGGVGAHGLEDILKDRKST